MSWDAEQRYRDLRRRAVVFSSLGMLLCVVLIAAFEPAGWGRGRTRTFELLARVQTFGHGFDWMHAPALLCVGIAAGALAGMLGMGGGVLKVAGMLLVFKLDILLARAVSLTTMLVATSSAAWVHLKERAVLKQVVKPMLIPAAASALLGVLAGSALPRVTLAHFFALFVLFLGFNTLAQACADPNETVFEGVFPRRLSASNRAAASTTGVLHGFFCGLLGISGGVIAMPMQQVLLRVPARNAIANSVFVSACCTMVASFAAVLTGAIRGDFALYDLVFATTCIGGGAAIGAQVGARLSGSVPVVVLKVLFTQVTFAAGLMILFK